MSDFRSPADVQKLLEATFEDYASRRISYYEQRGLLGKLLGRNLFLLSLRGIQNADEFVEASLTWACGPTSLCDLKDPYMECYVGEPRSESGHEDAYRETSK